MICSRRHRRGLTVKAKRSGASLEAPPSPHVSRTVAANNKAPSSAPAFRSSTFLSLMTLIAAGRKTTSAEENLTNELRLAGMQGAISMANFPATVLDPYRAASTFSSIKLLVLLLPSFCLHKLGSKLSVPTAGAGSSGSAATSEMQFEVVVSSQLRSFGASNVVDGMASLSRLHDRTRADNSCKLAV